MSTFHQTQRLIFIFDTTTLLNCGWLLVWIHFGWCSFPSCWFSTMKQIKRKSGDSFRVAFTNSGTCKTSFVCFEILRGHVVFERDPFRQALLTPSISLGTKPRLKNKDFFKCSSFFSQTILLLWLCFDAHLLHLLFRHFLLMQLLIFLLLFSFFLLKMENGKFLNTIEWMNGFSVFRIRNYVTFQNGDWLPAVKPWLLLFDILLSISICYRIICISRRIRKPVLALCMICLFKEWIVIFCSKKYWILVFDFEFFRFS